MRILHVIDSGGLYGAENMLLDLAAEQLESGHRPTIASIGAPSSGEKELERAAEERGIPVERFRMRPGPNYPGAFRILRFARREEIDLLHCHGYKGNILLGAIPRSLRRLPLVTTVHGYTSLDRLTRMKIYEWVDARLLPFLDAVVLVDDSVRRHPRLRGCEGVRFRVVQNGIRPAGGGGEGLPPPDPSLLDFCRRGPTFGAIGRLAPEKNFRSLVEAVRAVIDRGGDIRLLIIGEGGERQALEEQIGSLRLQERVRLAGFQLAARRYLPHLRAFVLSSLTEGLPITVLEAMQAGVPVLATRVGAVPELLEGGEAGFLVDAGSTAALVEGLRGLAQDPEGALRRGARAKRRVAELYSSRRMAAQYDSIYDEILRAGGLRHA